MRCCLVILAFLTVSPAVSGASGETEFFEKQIRPLLATHCHSCHSSEAKTRFAGLSLDTKSGLLKGGDSGPVVIPGDPARSRLIQAIRGERPVRMPPTGKLRDDEIAALTRWVDMGAPWPDESQAPVRQTPSSFDIEQRKREHWAWQPIRKTAPPAVKDTEWPLESLDRFLLAKLEAKGLTPAAPADRRTLIRRLSFDLTGLPPSPADVERFAKDPAPDSYQALINRFLASERFGERWARHWMDLVRYSESHGSEGDPDLPQAWRYRDYLIRAFNSDVPYDQLIREHLAGDLLPNPRINRETRLNESILGTAHLRMVEHGFQPVDPWEDRVKWMDNQIDVFSKTFQALTVSCARCHDHKFDAVSQRDFYALFGIFAGCRPTQVAINVAGDLKRNQAELRQLKSSVRDAMADAWRREAETLAARLESGELPERGESVDPENPLRLWSEVSGKQGEALRTAWEHAASQWRTELAESKAFNAANFKPAWDLRGSDFDAWLARGSGLPSQPSKPGEFAILPEGEAIIGAIYPGGVYSHLLSTKHDAVLASPRFTIGTDSISLRFLGGNFSTAQLIIENYAVPRGGIYNLRSTAKQDEMGWVRWDTSFWKGFTAYIEFATLDDLTYFQLDELDNKKKPKPEPKKDGRSWFGVQAVVFHSGKLPPKEVVSPLAVLLEGPVPVSRAELAARYSQVLKQAVDAWLEQRLSEEQAALLDGFLKWGVLPNSVAKLRELQPLVARYRALEAEVPVAARAPGVFDEPGGDQPLLIRGNLKNPGPKVPRAYLTALGGAPYTSPRTMRLRLAEDIAGPANPFTARVMVNRIWAKLFGRGLVATVDNFGKLGEPPTHPELLDHLATRFVDEGWSIKRIIRTMVASRAYQMSSTPSEAASRIDPANQLLQHMPVRRLEAEAIRDSMLAVSGQLELTMYGPSVPVYYAHETGQTKGDRPKGPLDGNGRRSIYLEVRRNATNPLFEVFDFPKPSTTRGERDLTNVPGQSLALLNSPFVIDQSASWARVLVLENATASNRIDAMFRKALGRPPSATEQTRAEMFVTEMGQEYGLAPGQLEPDPRVWQDLAQSIFNLKEFIYVR